MDVNRPGITDVFIAPYVVQQLFSRKDLIGRGGQEIQELQLFGGHVDRVPAVEDGVIRQVDNKVRIFDEFTLRLPL